MLDERESARLRRLVDDVLAFRPDESFAEVFGEFAGRRQLRDLARRLVFDHAAMLVFPEHDEDVCDLLTGMGLAVRAPVPSVVVRERLARRYGMAPDALAVSIIRGVVPDGPDAGRGVEIFSAPRSGARPVPPEVMAAERAARTEGHFAFTLRDPDAGNLESLRRVFLDRLEMRPDGGGYNPYDDAESGGRSVLYFAATAEHGFPGRFELTCAGHFPDIIAAHQRSALSGDREHAALLWLLTGQWAARAVYVAVRSGIADVLREHPLTAEDVAERTGCDPAATVRLLRYLAHLGVVDAERDSRYGLAPTGRLLCSADPFSDLVRLYGEEFAEAWGELLPAVRTGRSAFGLRYGTEHFDYFAEHQEAARTFDRAMSAVAALVADAAATAYDFPAGAAIVDVGGGNGALLRSVLAANPTVTGTVFDRDHVSAAVLADAGGRLGSVAGDFFAEVPAGADVYLLSRVLHDWDDDDCRRILAVVRAACGPDATLLIIERLLPDAVGRPATANLAVPWDMQMLAVTGGQERTRPEYEKLLTEAGFRAGEARTLPLDMNLIAAHPA